MANEVIFLHCNFEALSGGITLKSSLDEVIDFCCCSVAADGQWQVQTDTATYESTAVEWEIRNRLIHGFVLLLSGTSSLRRAAHYMPPMTEWWGW